MTDYAGEALLERRETAAHEAGHAVAAWSLDIKFTEVSIVPNDDTNGRVIRTGGGHVLPDGITPHTKKVREHHIIMLLAGGVAARRYSRKSWSDLGADSDLLKWRDLNASMGGSKAVQERRIEEAMYKAMDLLDAHWKSVVALSEALMEREHLTGDEAVKVIRSSIPRELHADRMVAWQDIAEMGLIGDDDPHTVGVLVVLPARLAWLRVR